MKYVASVVAVVACAGVASAAWNVTGRTSKVYAYGENAAVGQITSNLLTPFNETRSSSGTYGNASSTQSSSGGAFSATVSTRVSAQGYAKGGASGSYGAAQAISNFTLLFTVTGSIGYSLQGTRQLFPLSPNTATVYLKNLTTNTFVHNLQWGDPDAFNYAGTLGAGNYRLELSIDASASAGFNPQGTFDATWTVIPAPSACTMLGLAGLAAVRRRR